MGIFSGPSRKTLLTISKGIASYVMQIYMVSDLEDGDEKIAIIEKMKADGVPISINELAQMAGSVVKEYNLGWYKKSEFIGMVHGCLLAFGCSRIDANYIKGLIEVYS